MVVNKQSQKLFACGTEGGHGSARVNMAGQNFNPKNVKIQSVNIKMAPHDQD